MAAYAGNTQAKNFVRHVMLTHLLEAQLPVSKGGAFFLPGDGTFEAQQIVRPLGFAEQQMYAADFDLDGIGLMRRAYPGAEIRYIDAYEMLTELNARGVKLAYANLDLMGTYTPAHRRIFRRLSTMMIPGGYVGYAYLGARDAPLHLTGPDVEARRMQRVEKHTKSLRREFPHGNLVRIGDIAWQSKRPGSGGSPMHMLLFQWNPSRRVKYFKYTHQEVASGASNMFQGAHATPQTMRFAGLQA